MFNLTNFIFFINHFLIIKWKFRCFFFSNNGSNCKQATSTSIFDIFSLEKDFKLVTCITHNLSYFVLSIRLLTTKVC